jgi:hypothetical protein
MRSYVNDVNASIAQARELVNREFYMGAIAELDVAMEGLYKHRVVLGPVLFEEKRREILNIENEIGELE